MNKRKLVVEVEDVIGPLSGATEKEAWDPDDLIEVGYARARRKIEAAKVPLAEIGMYDRLVAGVDQADAWRKSARFHEAGELLFDLFQELMRKSGTSERYARRYGKRADGAEPPAPVAGELIEGCGPPGPDAYQGQFSAKAPARDKAAVSAVAMGLALLRAEAMITRATGPADLPGKFRALRQQAAHAEQPLEALGLHRLLQDTLAAAESFADEGEHAEADELLEEFERHLKARLG